MCMDTFIHFGKSFHKFFECCNAGINADDIATIPYGEAAGHYGTFFQIGKPSPQQPRLGPCPKPFPSFDLQHRLQIFTRVVRLCLEVMIGRSGRGIVRCISFQELISVEKVNAKTGMSK